MENGRLLMDWPQVLTFLGGIITIVAALIGVCAWFYKLTREQVMAIKEDVRAIDRKVDENARESRSQITAIHNLIESIREDGRIFREKWVEESRSFNEKWAAESREYHGRLCAIEERRAGRPRKEDRV
jgi:hypothetical protein